MHVHSRGFDCLFGLAVVTIECTLEVLTDQQATGMSDKQGQPSNSFQRVEIKREPVELYKILKFEGLASSGAEAKLLIDEGLVKVNGERELRRRRKIINNDLIEFGESQLKIFLSFG